MKRNNPLLIIVILVALSIALLAYHSMAAGEQMRHDSMTAMQDVSSSQGKTPQEVCLEHKCPMHQCGMQVRVHLKPGERIKCPICGEYITTENSKIVPVAEEKNAAAKEERKIIAYRNPMNPQVTSPVPMKDSMGMEYVPVYEEEGAAHPEGVSISPEKQKLMGISVSPVTKRDLVKIVHASGKIAYDPELVVTQEEFIQALKVQDETKDSPLQDVIDRAKSVTDAARQKLKLKGMSDDQIAELEKTRKAQTNLYLPAKGENVWAYVSVYEYEIGLIKVGMPVDIEAVAYPGEVFQGQVASVNPVLDAATRTNQVRVEIKNPDDKLKPEMFVSAMIKIDIGEKLAVPEDAVIDTGERKIVFVATPEGYFDSRDVTLGTKAEKYYEVLSGLTEGENVVSSGNFFVDSESQLKAPAATQTHQHQQ
ncbi:hypothetical protein BU251_07405 [Candidatus Velamenicoccus archaeovorus]|uniref:Uncharacterized protein n=1 Tax=Velamenicoccus archaeovorus TaxID=1930593 RepID=A0A410P6H7_VELA1|nr:efflux RND transporter periplasmic adaptor subunit [Candidatus Velamenicoccus archaeovorus]QAT17554.1 hypothetical protein BU251_07405 [Candidatus Velamenicoccus archaeovorus]